jgi:hypothetical protein
MGIMSDSLHARLGHHMLIQAAARIRRTAEYEKSRILSG